MSPRLMRILTKFKLILLWFRRILFAPDHFGHNIFRKFYLAVRGGYLLDQYYIYDFKHNDRREYLSEFDWYRSRYINSPFEPMLNNKLIATEVLGQYVKVPKAFVLKNNGKMVSLDYDAEDGFFEFEDVVALLERERYLFMKPVARGKGVGVYRLEMDEAGNVLIDGEITPKDAFRKFLDKRDGWFLSEGIDQHEFLNNLYDNATHTIRFITIRDPESGVIKPLFAVQRIGTAETAPVDNGSRGGLVAQINMETGVLSEAKSLQALAVHKVHPDSGTPIEGAVIPGWKDVVDQMVSLHRHVPFMNFIAWDILLVPDGICIIEANTSSGPNIIQLWGPQRYGELGDFYRAHGCIK